MRNPRAFLRPLAVGAPAPPGELPARPFRMIHFFPPQIEKVRAKIPQIIPQVDVLLGNLEDGIPAEDKEAAREGLIEVALNNEFGSTSLWTRINSLDSPWVLDDLLSVIPEIGNKLEVVMVPKVEGPWDIHYLDRLLAQLEAKHGIKKSLLIHAILETALGVSNVEEIAAPCTSPGTLPFYGPFGAIEDPLACQHQFRAAFLMGCVGAWTLHPSQIDIARREVSPPVEEGKTAKRIIEAMGDWAGTVMLDGRMQDDATFKQAQVMVQTARLIAERDPEYAELYGL